jgi:hypothetical protein
MSRRAVLFPLVLFLVSVSCSKSSGLTQPCESKPRSSTVSDSAEYVCLGDVEFHPTCATMLVSRLGQPLGEVGPRTRTYPTPRYAARTIVGVPEAEAIAIEDGKRDCSARDGPETAWLVTTRRGLTNERVNEIIEIAQRGA